VIFREASAGCQPPADSPGFTNVNSRVGAVARNTCHIAPSATEASSKIGRESGEKHEDQRPTAERPAVAKGVDIVISGPYSSGVLAGTHFEYQKVSLEIIAKVKRIKAVAQRHHVPIKANALPFSLAHPASAAVIPGASRSESIAEDHVALKAVIPADFRREMRKQELVAANAPPPIGR
jgi:D-threo-aldose 1-dehydrogenase